MSVFSIGEGRTVFWQWDMGQRMTVSGVQCSQVHFENEVLENALVVNVYEEEGKMFADVPNILLQTEGPLRVYAYIRNQNGQSTVWSEIFMVMSRAKPADYVYTETEMWTAEKAVAKALEEAKESGDFKGDPGPKGDPGAVKFVVATTLPEADAENAIYLLPNENNTEENLFDEYIFVDGKWEKIGSAAVEVNLDEYVKKTDYAAVDKAGVVKWNYTYGIRVSTDGTLRTYGATASDIDSRTGTYRPIVPSILDYAVKVSLTDSKETLADAEKAAACSWLGAARVAAGEDGTIVVLLPDGSKYKVNATREEN